MFSRIFSRYFTKEAAKAILPLPFQYLLGACYGLQTVYRVGSAVDGERYDNGKQKLAYSPVGYRNGDFLEHDGVPSCAVIFSLLHSREKKLTKIFSSDTVIPIHAENTSRGLFKLQQEGLNILAFSSIVTLTAGYATRNLPFFKMLCVQALLITGSSITYAAHRGNLPVGQPQNFLASSLSNELSKGNRLEQSGDKEKALEIYSKLTQTYPDCKVCRFHMGRLAKELENPPEVNINMGSKA